VILHAFFFKKFTFFELHLQQKTGINYLKLFQTIVV
jgi:hypothetical protein